MPAAFDFPYFMLSRIPPFVLRSAFVVALVVIFTLAMIPQPVVPMVVAFQDKLHHCAAFAVLMLMGWAGWPSRSLRVAGGLVLYGLLIEVAQDQLTTNRVGEPMDWLADSVGIAIGLGLIRLLTLRRPEER
jgi:hypothetical protein